MLATSLPSARWTSTNSSRSDNGRFRPTWGARLADEPCHQAGIYRECARSGDAHGAKQVDHVTILCQEATRPHSSEDDVVFAIVCLHRHKRQLSAQRYVRAHRQSPTGRLQGRSGSGWSTKNLRAASSRMSSWSSSHSTARRLARALWKACHAENRSGCSANRSCLNRRKAPGPRWPAPTDAQQIACRTR